MRSFKKYVSYLAFLLIVVLILIEISLRVTGRYKTYSEECCGQYSSYWNKKLNHRYHSHSPNDSFYQKQTEFRYLYETNEFGHREKDIDTLEEGGRILVFGDSFTEGVGAPYDSTWPRFLENYLHLDSVNTTVYICGSAGSDPFDSYTALRYQFLKYDPTHVIVAINASDLFDYAIKGGFKRYKGNSRKAYRKGPWWHVFYRFSHLFRAYIASLGSYDTTLMTYENWNKLQSEAVDSIAHSLELCNALSTSISAKFMALSHPGPLEICIDAAEFSGVNKIEAFNYNVPIVHLNQPIREAIMGEDCMDHGWPIDGHFTSLGYKVFATEFYEEVNLNYPDFFNITQK
ncbi:MAG: SGNH/GDSL hydrolase family protein [Bacteroidetes bacterium]|nr:SGNH/GDSL hydrolase family protein [Bacteroidota bacterium]